MSLIAGSTAYVDPGKYMWQVHFPLHDDKLWMCLACVCKYTVNNNTASQHTFLMKLIGSPSSPLQTLS